MSSNQWFNVAGNANLDDAGEKLPNFPPNGRFQVRIEGIKVFTTRKGQGAGVVEVTVLESSMDEVVAGTRYSVYYNLSNDMGPIDFRRFVGRVCGLATDEEIEQRITTDVVERVAGDEQGAAGRVMVVSTAAVKTRVGGDFTVHRWDPYVQGA